MTIPVTSTFSFHDDISRKVDFDASCFRGVKPSGWSYLPHVSVKESTDPLLPRLGSSLVPVSEESFHNWYTESKQLSERYTQGLLGLPSRPNWLVKIASEAHLRKFAEGAYTGSCAPCLSVKLNEETAIDVKGKEELNLSALEEGKVNDSCLSTEGSYDAVPVLENSVSSLSINGQDVCSVRNYKELSCKELFEKVLVIPKKDYINPWMDSYKQYSKKELLKLMNDRCEGDKRYNDNKESFKALAFISWAMVIYLNKPEDMIPVISAFDKAVKLDEEVVKYQLRQWLAMHHFKKIMIEGQVYDDCDTDNLLELLYDEGEVKFDSMVGLKVFVFCGWAECLRECASSEQVSINIVKILNYISMGFIYSLVSFTLWDAVRIGHFSDDSKKKYFKIDEATRKHSETFLKYLLYCLPIYYLQHVDFCEERKSVAKVICDLWMADMNYTDRGEAFKMIIEGTMTKALAKNILSQDLRKSLLKSQLKDVLVGMSNYSGKLMCFICSVADGRLNDAAGFLRNLKDYKDFSRGITGEKEWFDGFLSSFERIYVCLLGGRNKQMADLCRNAAQGGYSVEWGKAADYYGHCKCFKEAASCARKMALYSEEVAPENVNYWNTKSDYYKALSKGDSACNQDIEPAEKAPNCDTRKHHRKKRKNARRGEAGKRTDKLPVTESAASGVDTNDLPSVTGISLDGSDIAREAKRVKSTCEHVNTFVGRYKDNILDVSCIEAGWQVSTGNGKVLSPHEALLINNWSSQVNTILSRIRTARKNQDLSEELSVYGTALSDPRHKNFIGIERVYEELAWTLLHTQDKFFEPAAKYKTYGESTTLEATAVSDMAGKLIFAAFAKKLQLDTLSTEIEPEEIYRRAEEVLAKPEYQEPVIQAELRFRLRCLFSSMGHVYSIRAMCSPSHAQALGAKASQYYGFKRIDPNWERAK